MSTPNRAQQLADQVRALNDDERDAFDADLRSHESRVAIAWGEEIDRRAAQVRAGEVKGLDREELRKVMAMKPSDARTYLSRR